MDISSINVSVSTDSVVCCPPTFCPELMALNESITSSVVKPVMVTTIKPTMT